MLVVAFVSYTTSWDTTLPGVDDMPNACFIEGRYIADVEVRVAGTIVRDSRATLDFFESTGSHIEVAASGRVLGGEVMAIEVSYDAVISNLGEISNGVGFGVVVVDPDPEGLVTNWGSIFGEVGGVEFTGDRDHDSPAAASKTRSLDPVINRS